MASHMGSNPTDVDTQKRRALVCGATGGLGASIVEALLECEDIERVFACGRSAPQNAGLAALSTRYEGRLTRLRMDAGSAESIAETADTVRASTDRLDLVVNTVGLLHDETRHPALRPERRLEEVEPENLEVLFRVNAMGFILVAQSFMPLLRGAHRSILANISARVGSIADNRLGGWYGYRASKAAQNMFTKTLAIECQRSAKNLIILSLHPGTVETALSAPFRRNVKNLLTPRESAEALLTIMDNATLQDSGSFIAWSGERIPW